MSTNHQPLVDRVLSVMGDTENGPSREVSPEKGECNTDALVNFFLGEHEGTEYLREHLIMLVDIAMRAQKQIDVGQLRRLSRQFHLQTFGAMVETAIMRGEK